MSETPSAPPAAEAKPREAYTAHWWQIHAWGLGAVPKYWLYEQFALIFQVFTIEFAMPGWLVGGILASPRLIDGALDPIIGHWSDNLRSRWGRRKPFLLAAALFGAIMVVAHWFQSPDWPLWVQGVYLGFFSILLFICYGTYEMAYFSLGYELSEDYAHRSRVDAIRSVYERLSSAVGGWVYPLAIALGTGYLLVPKNDWFREWTGLSWSPSLQLPNVGGTINGFRWISIFIALIVIGFTLFPLLYTKEIYKDRVKKDHVGILKALKATMTCRPFIIVLIRNFANFTGGTIYRTLTLYIGIYSVCGGDKQQYLTVMHGFGAIASLLFGLAVWPLARPLTKHIGKRRALIIAAGVSLAWAVALPFIASPGNIYVWFWAGVALMPLNAVLGAASGGIMADICDVDELKYGERREGLFTAVQSFMNKMEIAGMTVLSGLLLTWSGFNATIVGNQPQEVLSNLRWLGFTPLIVSSLLGFVATWFFPLTGKVMADVRAQLDARHAQAAAEAAAADKTGTT